MEQASASRTAIGAALHRAAHQILDRPLVFTDPLACAIVGDAAMAPVRGGTDERLARPGMRAFIAARSRLAEDVLADAYARGIRQYVLLGAGLDTFGCRSDRFTGLATFEVDHPASQADKRHRLAAAGITVPASLTFAAVDFETQTLADGLGRAGFDPGTRAQFAMLGVSMYLTAEALAGTLGYVAARPPGTGIVFDYAATSTSATAAQRAAATELAARVASAGEPFTGAIAPGELHQMLRGHGFSAIEDFGSAELNSRYFSRRDDGLELRGTARMISARV